MTSVSICSETLDVNAVTIQLDFYVASVSIPNVLDRVITHYKRNGGLLTDKTSWSESTEVKRGLTAEEILFLHDKLANALVISSTSIPCSLSSG